VDMTQTHENTPVIPTITGKSNINAKPLPASVSGLVIVHAICLAGSFLLLFPAGVILLRFFGSVRFHWMLQVFALCVCVLGLVIAIVFSVMDPEFSSFDSAHQILGIIAVVALAVQAFLGYRHHHQYKKIGQRTWVSHSHIWVGRVVVILGMVNGIL